MIVMVDFAGIVAKAQR